MSRPSPRTAVGSTLLTASALVLTAIFLSQHRAELGSFFATVPAFSALVNRYGILNIQSAAHSTAGVLAAMLVAVAWYGLGTAVLGSVRSAVGEDPALVRGLPARSSSRRHAPWEREPGPCFGSRSAWWASISRVRPLRPWPGGSPSRHGRWSVHAGREPTPGGPIGAGACGGAPMVALPVALAFVAAVAPPTAKDALQYHLALPKAFVAARGLIDVPDNIANYFALGAEMHGVWAMLLGRIVSPRAGEVAFGAVTFAFFPLLLAAVFGWARERGLGRDWAWLAAAMVAGVPTVLEGGKWVCGPRARAVRDPCDPLDRPLVGHAGPGESCGVGPGAGICPGGEADSRVRGVCLRPDRPSPGTPSRGRKPAGAARSPCRGLGRAGRRRRARRPLVVSADGRARGVPVFPFFANVWPGRAPGWDQERSAMLAGSSTRSTEVRTRGRSTTC